MTLEQLRKRLDEYRQHKIDAPLSAAETAEFKRRILHSDPGNGARYTLKDFAEAPPHHVRLALLFLANVEGYVGAESMGHVKIVPGSHESSSSAVVIIYEEVIDEATGIQLGDGRMTERYLFNEECMATLGCYFEMCNHFSTAVFDA